MSEPCAALKACGKYDFHNNRMPKCPHCGHECDISRNEWYRLYEEGEHDVECPQCEGEFSVSTRVSFSFDTDHQEKTNG